MKNLIFDRDYLASLYSRDQQKRMAHIENLIDNEKTFLTAPPDGLPKSLATIKKPLQIQKDETIITLFTFAALHLVGSVVWGKLLSNLFQQEWGNIDTAYNLQQEKAIFLPQEFKPTNIYKVERYK